MRKKPEKKAFKDPYFLDLLFKNGGGPKHEKKDFLLASFLYIVVWANFSSKTLECAWNLRAGGKSEQSKSEIVFKVLFSSLLFPLPHT